MLTRRTLLMRIKKYVNLLNELLHYGEEEVYTCLDDWGWASAVNVIIGDGTMETHSTKMLKIVDNEVICIDDEYIEIPIKELDDRELDSILYMLEQAYLELTTPKNN